jgi:NADH:ubiquinone oxidoreductase subunit C
MFGIYIKNHNDLRRILTDYQFLGSPLRKDFPLTGYIEIRYDEDLKNIVVNNLELSQELREFRLENP